MAGRVTRGVTPRFVRTANSPCSARRFRVVSGRTSSSAALPARGSARRAPAGGYAASATPAAANRSSAEERPFPRLLERRRACRPVGRPHVVRGLHRALRRFGQLGCEHPVPLEGKRVGWRPTRSGEVRGPLHAGAGARTRPVVNSCAPYQNTESGAQGEI